MNRHLHTGLMAALAWSATACGADAMMQTTFLPGVAVDPQQTRAFSSGVDGRLIAIDLSNGSIGWRSRRTLEALGFVDGNVIAFSRVEKCQHCLQLVWLSAVDGHEQRTSKTISFPDWVNVEPVAGKQFRATVEAEAGSLKLHWNASSRYAGGAAPTSEILADFRKDANGTFMIDPQGQAAAATAQSQPAIAIPAALRDVDTASWWNCSEWRDTPVTESDGMVAFELSAGPNGQTLTARRWRLPSGRLDATRQLMQGSNLGLQTSPDARYLFVHDGIIGDAVKGSARRWQVFSLRTLRPVANVPYLAGQTCANVAANAVVTLIEKSPPPNRGGSRSRDLVAYATSNGEVRWSVKLRGDPQLPHPR